jgi:ribose 5-phosphate isomerase B
MKIYIASDHGGYYLKEELKSYLEKKGHNVEDFGNQKFQARDDYPDFVFPLAEAIVKDKRARGIILGRSGNGEAIAANKVKGVYAAHCMSVKMAKRAREHNNANVISLGAEYIGATAAKRVVDVFVSTSFSGAKRHKRRVKKIKKYESSHLK